MAQRSHATRGVPCNRRAEARCKRKSLVLHPDVPEDFELEIAVKAEPFAPRPDVPYPDVVDVCHRDILAQLEKLAILASGLHADVDAGARSQVRELVAFFTGPAREHNDDEERHVFPALLQHEDEEVRNAAETLREDHAWIELYWLDIEPQLAAVADGVSTFDPFALRAAAEVFDAVMRDHVALEESLLYAQLRGRLKSTLVRRQQAEVLRSQAG
jgi:hemerythrin-like domain-containing protein